MNEQTAQLIRELADKLGTTGEHLWGVLVAQAKWDFLASTIQYAIIAAVILGFLKSAHIVYINVNESEDRPFWQLLLWIVAMIVLGVLSIGLFAAGFDYLPQYIASIANPEYWALKQILK